MLFLMSWIATERFEARTAPAGLALVQELINTHAVERGPGADLLADRAPAQEWLAGAARQWAESRGADAPQVSLSDADVEALRDLRALVVEMLAVPFDERPAGAPGPFAGLTGRAPVVLVSDPQGRVGLMPSGTGLGWLESAVWSEILLAQQSGEWARLKLCRESGCRSAFYDTSRNSSGVWHNVRTCGNIANLRAARDRKKQRTTADGGPGRGGEPAGAQEAADSRGRA
ncbi:hypothetical protein Sm713_01700 [Streptomyces sp. TS71-3]|nr:hypothetical protein Sm713_01700 [Streptomyces sp. TS71-3]